VSNAGLYVDVDDLKNDVVIRRWDFVAVDDHGLGHH
jgi:hypothetical protein